MLLLSFNTISLTLSAEIMVDEAPNPSTFSLSGNNGTTEVIIGNNLISKLYYIGTTYNISISLTNTSTSSIQCNFYPENAPWTPFNETIQPGESGAFPVTYYGVLPNESTPPLQIILKLANSSGSAEGSVAFHLISEGNPPITPQLTGDHYFTLISCFGVFFIFISSHVLKKREV